MKYLTQICCFTVVTAFLALLGGCTKDLTYYRTQIIGTWVEQTFDGQIPPTDQRGVSNFNQENKRNTTRAVEDAEGARTLGSLEAFYDISCKILSLDGDIDPDKSGLMHQKQEILSFTDTTLHVRIIENTLDGAPVTPPVKEITYKKVSKENKNATTIQGTWEYANGSEPDTPPFQIRCDLGSVYKFFLKNEDGAWEEKKNENGKYTVYDNFLMMSFFDNPVFGSTQKEDIACWDIAFPETGVQTMVWTAIVSNNPTVVRTINFALVVPEE